tara:strand:- start:897 stop:1325 length:429 start_codon:yes stop_codon:yes gene_type:complete
MESIERLMLKEHKRLNKCLEDVEKNIEDYEKTKLSFNKCKWNLEKHFFVEEKVIFDNFVSMSGQETTDTFHLLEDHVRIIELLKKLEQRLEKKIKPDTNLLRNVLSTHRKFEEEDFYPNLDDKLTLEQKKQMAKKIREIIPG